MAYLRWLTSHWFIGFSMLAVLMWLHFGGNPYVEELRFKAFDVYQQLAPRIPNKSKQLAPVAIIDLDDATLEKYGQWPWPRDLIAKLVQNLFRYGVAVVGFDIVFAERDRMSPDMIAENLPDLPDEMRERLLAMPTNESILAEVLGENRVVLGQVGVEKDNIKSPVTPKVRFFVKKKKGAPDPLLARYPGVIRNLPELEKAAPGIGLFSTLPDRDGVYRRVALVNKVGEEMFPALSLEMIRVGLQGRENYVIHSDETGAVQDVVVKTGNGQGFKIPTDPQGNVWVHFAEYQTTDPIYIPAKDVLDGAVENARERLAGHLVIIGTSAVGLKDIRPTPINGQLPGVEVHAHLLETILSESYLTRPLELQHIELLVIFISGFLLIFLVPRLNAAYNFLLSISIMGGLFVASWYYYTHERQLMDAITPALSIFWMFITLSYINYMREEKERAQIKNAFGHYVSPALLQEIAENPEKLSLGGATRHITLLFSDIRGFTTISEQFDAEGLTRFINKFLTPMTNVILENKGTVDKYMGDAIMAFWNAPLEVPDHPIQACRAALDMQVAVKTLNADLEKEAEREGRKHVPIHIGVGLNTGDCCVGNMGSEQRFDYSALGDHVNLASRLEGQSKTYGVDIVIGENTRNELQGNFATIELDLIQVKGKTEPVYIFALLGDNDLRNDAGFQKLLEMHETMLQLYRLQKWDEAEAQIAAIEAYHADAGHIPPLAVLYALYRERIADYRAQPPGEDWNGVFIATSK